MPPPRVPTAGGGALEMGVGALRGWRVARWARSEMRRARARARTDEYVPSGTQWWSMKHEPGSGLSGSAHDERHEGMVPVELSLIV